MTSFLTVRSLKNRRFDEIELINSNIHQHPFSSTLIETQEKKPIFIDELFSSATKEEKKARNVFFFCHEFCFRASVLPGRPRFRQSNLWSSTLAHRNTLMKIDFRPLDPGSSFLSWRNIFMINNSSMHNFFMSCVCLTNNAFLRQSDVLLFYEEIFHQVRLSTFHYTIDISHEGQVFLCRICDYHFSYAQIFTSWLSLTNVIFSCVLTHHYFIEHVSTKNVSIEDRYFFSSNHLLTEALHDRRFTDAVNVRTKRWIISRENRFLKESIGELQFCSIEKFHQKSSPPRERERLDRLTRTRHRCPFQWSIYL